ncbi:unnamed protein product, partial [Ceratitis capitata]
IARVDLTTPLSPKALPFTTLSSDPLSHRVEKPKKFFAKYCYTGIVGFFKLMRTMRKIVVVTENVTIARRYIIPSCMPIYASTSNTTTIDPALRNRHSTSDGHRKRAYSAITGSSARSIGSLFANKLDLSIACTAYPATDVSGS